jgi:hypothetical protein
MFEPDKLSPLMRQAMLSRLDDVLAMLERVEDLATAVGRQEEWSSLSVRLAIVRTRLTVGEGGHLLADYAERFADDYVRFLAVVLPDMDAA